jgi:hypothetical protein
MKAAIALAALILSQGLALAGDSPASPGNAANEWIIRAAPDGMVTVQAPDGSIIEARQLQLTIPARDRASAPRRCKIEAQPDAMFLMTLDQPPVDGVAQRYRARANLMLLDVKSGSAELGPGHVNLERPLRKP